MKYTLYDDRGRVVDTSDSIESICKRNSIPYLTALHGLTEAGEFAYNAQLITCPKYVDPPRGDLNDIYY